MWITNNASNHFTNIKYCNTVFAKRTLPTSIEMDYLFINYYLLCFMYYYYK